MMNFNRLSAILTYAPENMENYLLQRCKPSALSRVLEKRSKGSNNDVILHNQVVPRSVFLKTHCIKTDERESPQEA